MGYGYLYDQLNRLAAMNRYNMTGGSQPYGWNATPATDYQERIAYDGNGNIQSYNRNGTTAGGRSQAMDVLTYNYNRDGNGYLLNNRLRYIHDAAPGGSPLAGDPQDLADQPVDNYSYDKIGNLVGNSIENIQRINWTVYGKMASLSKGGSQGLSFGYDAGGNRVTKVAVGADGTGVTTHYVRDAQGNVLAAYEYKTNASGGVTEADWSEQHLYGSSRLGMLQPHVVIPAGQPLSVNYDGSVDAAIEARGNRLYELTNHLGNVLATITDKPVAVSLSGGGTAPGADLVSAQDYYPFGMQMPGRTYLAGSSLSYRYGFNGKEKDDEVMGAGNEIDYGMRVYDPRAGRFLSVDPLTKTYPWYIPYQFAGNTPLQAIDRDGQEEWKVNNGKGIVIGPYSNQQAAQNAVNTGLAKPLPPAVITSPSQPVQKTSTFKEVIGTLHTVWKLVTWDPSNPIAAQPEATTPGGQLLEMTTPYIPYEKIGGAALGKLWPEIFGSGIQTVTKSVILKIPQGLTEEEFKEMSKMITEKVGGMSDNIVVQGSRAAGTVTAASDIDIAIKVSEKDFSTFLAKQFKTVNPLTSKEKTFINAFRTGKVQSGEAGLRGLRIALEKVLGKDVDISVIKEGGPFDNGPQIPINAPKSN